jgi:hypothetical protein
MDDIAGFLASHPPFDAVGTDDVPRVAAVTEIEFHPAGKTIFSQGAGPVEYLWVVRTGSVEIVHDGRVLDLLGPVSCSGMPRCSPGFRPVRAENRIHGPDQHSCSPGGRPVMITDSCACGWSSS